MDYSKMSDTEINELVARITGSHFDEEGPCHFDYSGIDSPYSDGEPMRVAFDPCNSPEDAWPIIVGHKLSLINADDEWLCVPDDTAVDGTTGDEVQMIYSGDGHVHANPLRAAMIVFLMMQESANVQDYPA